MQNSFLDVAEARARLLKAMGNTGITPRGRSSSNFRVYWSRSPIFGLARSWLLFCKR